MTVAPAVPSVNKASSFFAKKVLGVPVLYLTAGFVLILAVFAWQMKASPTADAAADPAEKAGDTLLSESDYPPIPLGTVIAGATAETEPVDTKIGDNDEWLRQGVMFLSGQGVSPGAAQEALTLYLEGENLSFQQGYWRDEVIHKLGMPPYPVSVGSTQPDIGRAQGPLPRAHIVKNVNENSAIKLAQIYYQRSDHFAVQAITGVNGNRVNFEIGDAVQIPRLPTPSTGMPVKTVITRHGTPVITTVTRPTGNTGPLPPA